MIRCWASVLDGGPTSNQRWVLCLLGQGKRVGGGVLSKPTGRRASVRRYKRRWPRTGTAPGRRHMLDI